MLADRHHARGAAHTCRELLEQHGDGGHEPVLEAHPGEPGAVGRPAAHIEAVVDGGAHRLLHHHGQVGGEHIVQHRGVGVVRGGDDDCVEIVAGQQLTVVGVGGDGCSRSVAAPVERRLDRVGDGHHLGLRKVDEVGDVLAAHHPGADDAVAHGCLSHGAQCGIAAGSIRRADRSVPPCARLGPDWAHRACAADGRRGS